MRVITSKRIKQAKKDDSDGEDNPYAICTDSIGETAGTTKRSEWDEDDKDRYDRCIEHVKEDDKEKEMSDGDEDNPWAICHSQVDKDENPDKFERCVKDVKDQ